MYYLWSRVARVPFRKSNTKVTVPAVFPKIRKVLVVPVLPLPHSRKFFLKKICPIHKPVGIEPSKYAKIRPKIVFIINLLYHEFCFVFSNLVNYLSNPIKMFISRLLWQKLLQNFIKTCKIVRMNNAGGSLWQRRKSILIIIMMMPFKY